MKSVAILLTDHESINEKILLKSLNRLKKTILDKIYIIGDINKFSNFYEKSKDIKKIQFIKFNLKQNNNQKYLKNITMMSIKLFKKKKINFLINMPLNKKKYLDNHIGYTEFFSDLFDGKKNENMLLYNENFSVCPLTTHIELSEVNKNISVSKLSKCIENLIYFYKQRIGKQIEICVLGLNPHASKDFRVKTKDKTVIKYVVNKFKKRGINIKGPLSADTAFNSVRKKVFIGMYHDQVLIPFKLLNKFNGINVTIGKDLIRMSPDHGTGKDIFKSKKNIFNQSFIKCIDFCEKTKC